MHNKSVVVAPASQQPKRKRTQLKKPNICKCKKCGAEACVPCDRPRHKEYTCAEYQFHNRQHVAEDHMSLTEIEKATRKCPNCLVNVQRDGGSPHMTCECNIPVSH